MCVCMCCVHREEEVNSKGKGGFVVQTNVLLSQLNCLLQNKEAACFLV